MRKLVYLSHRNQANIRGRDRGVSGQHCFWELEGEGQGWIQSMVGSLPGDQCKEPNQWDEPQCGRRNHLAGDGGS